MPLAPSTNDARDNTEHLHLCVLLDLALSTVRPDAEPREALIHAGHIDDWDAFVQLARREGMGVYLDVHRPALARLGCPERLLEACATHAARVERLRSRHLALLEEIAAAAEAKGIPIALLKGAFQNIAGVPNRLLRKMADLNLLVRRDDAAAFVDILRPLGFGAGASNWQRQEHRALVEKWKQIFNGRGSLYRGHDSVDVHWNPVYIVDGHAVTFAADDVLIRATPMPFGGSRLVVAPAFALAHMLVHCVSTAENEGPSLSRVLDVALTASHCGLDFTDLDGAWSSPVAATVRPLLKCYWDAGMSAIAGDIEPWVELRRRRLRSARRQFLRSRVAFFLGACSWRERVICLACVAAYVRRTRFRSLPT